MSSFGFNRSGIPVEFKGDFLLTCSKERIPFSIGKNTYFDAVQEAFPNVSKSEIRRWFKSNSVKVYGYNCGIDENPSELFSGCFTFAVFTVGKRRGVLFK